MKNNNILNLIFFLFIFNLIITIKSNDVNIPFLIKNNNPLKRNEVFYEKNDKQIKLKYNYLNEKFYSKIFLKTNNSNTSSEVEDFHIILQKNHLNYSINDGIFLEFDKNQFNQNFGPKHIRFSFKIDKEDKNKYSEQCNIRLTNSTIQNLIQNDYRTFNSDPLFFRIRTNNSIVLNDKYFYFTNFSENNYDSNFKDIDLFLDWENHKVFVLYQKNILDNMLTLHDMQTDFYHKNLELNYTNPNKLIIYNFHPNTSCEFRNLEICEDFCDKDTSNLYKNITSSLNFNVLKLNLSLISLIVMSVIM